MAKLKDIFLGAVIVASAAIINIFGVKNLISDIFKESTVSIDVVSNETIELIELKEFSKADRMLSGMKSNSTELEMIVEEIVKKINQFDISFEYATKTSVPEVIYLILKNLWIEQNSGNDTNLIQLMDIYKAFYSKVIQNKNFQNESLKSLAREICEVEIRSEIQNKSVTHLKSLLLAKSFDEISTKKFLVFLFKTSEEIFENVNKLVIDQIQDILPLDELLYRTFQSTCYPFPLNVFTISHLLSKNARILMVREFDFWIPVWLIEEKQKYEQNNNLSDFTKNKFAQLLGYFSPDVKILLLSENVCFRNYVSNEYICRSSMKNKTWKDFQEHNVELCTEKSLKNFWRIDYLLHDIFHIQDSNNTEQRMYIFETEPDDVGKPVHVGTASGYDGWEFYKKDNSFLIFNMGTFEYLCLSDNKREISLMENGRHHDECRWLVENCDFL